MTEILILRRYQYEFSVTSFIAHFCKFCTVVRCLNVTYMQCNEQSLLIVVLNAAARIQFVILYRLVAVICIFRRLKIRYNYNLMLGCSEDESPDIW